MPNKQIFGAGQTGRSLADCAQRRVNCFRHVVRDPAKADRGAVSFWARPGLANWKYYGASALRGWREVPPYLYIVVGATLYQVDSNGNTTALGNLLTANGPVFLDDNATQLGLSDTLGNLYVYQIFGVSAGTGLAAGNMQTFTAGLLGFLGSRHFTYLDNAGIVAVPGTNPLTSQQMQQSNLGDFTGWNALAFNFADSQGDTLVACKGYKGVLYAFGTKSTEIWQNLGLALFQFGRTPTSVQAMGLAAVGSIAEFGDLGLAVLGQSPGGQAVPTLLTPGGGFLPEEQNPLGDPDMVAQINARDAQGNLLYGTLADATGSSFMHDKHRFYLLSFPTAQKCWVWDQQSGDWSEWTSDIGVPGVLGPTGVYGAFRGLRAITFNGQLLFSDFADGHVYRALGTGVQDSDRDCPFPMQLVSQHLYQDDRVLTLNSLQLDLEEGVGNPLEPNPQALLEISRDKGRTYDAPVPAAIGVQGDYDNRVVEYMLGSARNLTVRLTMAGKHKRVLTGEAFELDVEAA